MVIGPEHSINKFNRDSNEETMFEIVTQVIKLHFEKHL